MDTTAVIVCAGSASRMGGTDKIMLKIGGVEAITRILTVFQNAPSIKEIIIVTKENTIENIQKIAENAGILKLSGVCAGGETRQESVIQGLKISSPENPLVAVHDGARPLVTVEAVENVIADAKTFGAALLGVPVKDTIKVTDGGFVIDTPHRPSLFIAQTPQVFDRKLYIRGIDFALRNGLDFTDDCQLVEAVGGKVYLTAGDYRNIKITTPEDVHTANLFAEGLI